ncbi:hypothetical protein TNCT_139921 [Trichonephila clavata]|uniref:Uncharacterized protein n=1 Tax=Trichonephila clavata TaxID=2740835 RepID=A0A8X6H969_TRICU|nr:hypothetical protein TNCT_139921 [Trichonephila clavata]
MDSATGAYVQRDGIKNCPVLNENFFKNFSFAEGWGMVNLVRSVKMSGITVVGSAAPLSFPSAPEKARIRVAWENPPRVGPVLRRENVFGEKKLLNFLISF